MLFCSCVNQLDWSSSSVRALLASWDHFLCLSLLLVSSLWDMKLCYLIRHLIAKHASSVHYRARLYMFVFRVVLCGASCPCPVVLVLCVGLVSSVCICLFFSCLLFLFFFLCFSFLSSVAANVPFTFNHWSKTLGLCLSCYFSMSYSVVASSSRVEY